MARTAVTPDEQRDEGLLDEHVYPIHSKESSHYSRCSSGSRGHGKTQKTGSFGGAQAGDGPIPRYW
jgi:hypothetical protein